MDDLRSRKIPKASPWGFYGFPGAVELRAKLMEAPDAASVEAAVEKFLSIT